MKFAVAAGRSGGTLIKGMMSNVPEPGLFKGFSASGQDVWVEEAQYKGKRGIVVSAVGARCGKCFKADGDWSAIANTMVLIPRPGFNRDYLWYVLNNEAFWEKGGTAQPYVRFDESLTRAWNFPSETEQAVIADFLDRETSKADELMAKYEGLIERLEEKRLALISAAVTKGLDFAAPMKDSGGVGVEEVPVHWGVAAVWMLFEIGRGRVISHDDIRANPGDYPVYSSQTEANGEMGKIGTFDFDGDYLTWTTDGANAGSVFERHGRFNCTNVCGTLKPRSMVASLTYFQYALNIATKYFVRLDINPKLMNDVMARIRLPLPPADEQMKIVAHLGAALASIRILRERMESAITLLREHRSALIAASVTGQIDVGTYRAARARVSA